MTAVTAGASAAGTVIQNPYWVGSACCCPGGVGGWNEVTGETPAVVIVADVPVVLKHPAASPESSIEPAGQPGADRGVLHAHVFQDER